MSRADHPKQFLALTDTATMFQLTVQRCSDPARFAPPLIVAGSAHAQIVQDQLTQIGVSDATLLLEPSARNTAPAIALAALTVDPAAPILVMPSDHVITDPAAFDAAIAAALPLVEAGWLATFGISPTGPETGYGYIKTGAEQAPGVFAVDRFVEKPDAGRAAEMISSGDHVWNGGIFLFRADAYLDALAAFAPEMLAAAKQAMTNARIDGNAYYPDADAFAASPADSIDYAVMEKAERVAVVPVAMGWSDIGSWDALYDLGGDAPNGPVLSIDSASNLVRSDGINVHLVGVENMIVVASGNDVLILPRGQSQDVKKVVEALKAKPMPERGS
jgi:mannose-1-phosphate guanylyltransferase/mannose-1-phosphate guanylyltransferase/mannose-6-phosphate isomerase